MKTRTIEEIKKKIEKGSAVVMTAQELAEAVEDGQKFTFDDIDVITTATKGLMSGTSAIFSFKVAEKGLFKRALETKMNGIRCFVGPCPNETLGMVDLIVHGTSRSMEIPRYGGGHLFRDLTEGRQIDIEVYTTSSKKIQLQITLEEMFFAKMMGIRHAFRNYNSFVNPYKDSIETIFSITKMPGNHQAITFCGCGCINPLQNDPNLEIIGVGTPILMNGAIGRVLGEGTRSSRKKPNLMSLADIFDMKPEYLGGFNTSEGPETICSWAVPIPIVNERIFKGLKFSDSDVPLNLVNVIGRETLHKINYDQVWKKDSYYITFNREKCIDCDPCPIEKICPTDCFSVENGIDKSHCFNCGTCVMNCSENAFIGDLGTVRYKENVIPIVGRQSDRFGAIQIANELKEKILKSDFPLNLPLEPLSFKVDKYSY